PMVRRLVVAPQRHGTRSARDPPRRGTPCAPSDSYLVSRDPEWPTRPSRWSPRMSTQVSHRVDRGRGVGVDTIGRGRGRVGAPPRAEPPAPMTRPRVRGREPSGSPPRVAPLRPGWVIVLGLVARVGLALLITAGFASGVALQAGHSVLSPDVIRGCG